MGITGITVKHDSGSFSGLGERVKVTSQVYGFPIIQGSPAQCPGTEQLGWYLRLSSSALSSHTQEPVLIQFREDPFVRGLGGRCSALLI